MLNFTHSMSRTWRRISFTPCWEIHLAESKYISLLGCRVFRNMASLWRCCALTHWREV